MNDVFLISAFLRENKKELFLLLIFGGILLTMIRSLTSISTTSESVLPQDVVLHMEQMVIDNFEKDRKTWQVEGKNANALQDTTKVLIDDVIIRVYAQTPAPKEQIDATVVARKGELDTNLKRIKLVEDVHMTRNAYTKLLAQEAYYYYDLGTLHIPDKVTIVQGQDHLKGFNLKYRVNEKKYTMEKTVIFN